MQHLTHVAADLDDRAIAQSVGEVQPSQRPDVAPPAGERKAAVGGEPSPDTQQQVASLDVRHGLHGCVASELGPCLARSERSQGEKREEPEANAPGSSGREHPRVRSVSATPVAGQFLVAFMMSVT